MPMSVKKVDEIMIRNKILRKSICDYSKNVMIKKIKSLNKGTYVPLLFAE
jgi:hypothetical protein